jgi:uncharacterized membrane protein YkvA (DUF1232 family)
MDNSPKRIIPSSGGFLHELALRIKLILRLMGDKRVNFFVKLLPIFSLLYIVNPIDIPGPLDDAAVVGLGMYLFFELCPPDVVQEHLNELRGVNIDEEIPKSTAKSSSTSKSDYIIIDGDFRDAEDEEEEVS